MNGNGTLTKSVDHLDSIENMEFEFWVSGQ